MNYNVIPCSRSILHMGLMYARMYHSCMCHASSKPKAIFSTFQVRSMCFEEDTICMIWWQNRALYAVKLGWIHIYYLLFSTTVSRAELALNFDETMSVLLQIIKFLFHFSLQDWIALKSRELGLMRSRL